MMFGWSKRLEDRNDAEMWRDHQKSEKEKLEKERVKLTVDITLTNGEVITEVHEYGYSDHIGSAKDVARFLVGRCYENVCISGVKLKTGFYPHTSIFKIEHKIEDIDDAQ